MPSRKGPVEPFHLPFSLHTSISPSKMGFQNTPKRHTFWLVWDVVVGPSKQLSVEYSGPAPLKKAKRLKSKTQKNKIKTNVVQRHNEKSYRGGIQWHQFSVHQFLDGAIADPAA